MKTPSVLTIANIEHWYKGTCFVYQCILSIFPEGGHQFHANILVFLNINPRTNLHCQCKLSIFSLSSFGPCIVFWILQKGTCIGKCIFSIFPAVTHQLKCKQTCIEKCRPRHKISMKKWLKIHQISKNVNLFPYITTNLHWIILTFGQMNNQHNEQ